VGHSAPPHVGEALVRIGPKVQVRIQHRPSPFGLFLRVKQGSGGGSQCGPEKGTAREGMRFHARESIKNGAPGKLGQPKSLPGASNRLAGVGGPGIHRAVIVILSLRTVDSWPQNGVRCFCSL
jgi:hypothetical protein